MAVFSLNNVDYKIENSSAFLLQELAKTLQGEVDGEIIVGAITTACPSLDPDLIGIFTSSGKYLIKLTDFDIADFMLALDLAREEEKLEKLAQIPVTEQTEEKINLAKTKIELAIAKAQEKAIEAKLNIFMQGLEPEKTTGARNLKPAKPQGFKPTIVEKPVSVEVVKESEEVVKLKAQLAELQAQQ